MKLPIPFVAQPPPIQEDDAGVLRVGGTCVRLETIINAFNNGSTAEEILLKHPSLNLTDIYVVIRYLVKPCRSGRGYKRLAAEQL